MLVASRREVGERGSRGERVVPDPCSARGWRRGRREVGGFRILDVIRFPNRSQKWAHKPVTLHMLFLLHCTCCLSVWNAPKMVPKMTMHQRILGKLRNSWKIKENKEKPETETEHKENHRNTRKGEEKQGKARGKARDRDRTQRKS